MPANNNAKHLGHLLQSSFLSTPISAVVIGLGPRYPASVGHKRMGQWSINYQFFAGHSFVYSVSA